MLSGVSILCFASSYAIALALEISRLLFRSTVRRLIRLGFAGAGLVAHSALLYYRAASTVGVPLSTEKDWYLVAAWVLVAAYLYLAFYHPSAPFGLFLLPLALALIGAAAFWANAEPLAREPASKIWGVIHGVSIVLAAVSVLLGFAAGLMYLGQMRHLKHKILPTLALRLPSLEWLQRANGRTIVVSVLCLAVGVASGMILNRINIESGAARLPWHDPVVLSTLLLLFWLVAAVLVSALYRPARQGRKVAYLTLVSFVFLALVLAAGLLLNSRHWERKGDGGRGKVEAGRVVTYWFPRSAWEPASSDARRRTGRRRASQTVRSHAERGNEGYYPLSSTHYPLSTIHYRLAARPSFPGGRPC